jgi:hypothetical protein
VNQDKKRVKRVTDFKKIDTDRYKPIQQFLLNSSNELRNDEHLNLVALLFDVQPRPFNSFLNKGCQQMLEIPSNAETDKGPTAKEIEEYTRRIVAEDRKLICELEDKYPKTFMYAAFGGDVDENLMNEMMIVCMKITDFWVEYILNRKRMDKDKFNGWILFNKKMYACSIYLRNYIKEHKYLFDQDFFEQLGINEEELCD